MRKLKEILLATQLEALFERHYGAGYKDRLLEIYINGSFYGANAYGIADAAQTYFGKRAAELSLLESAILARASQCAECAQSLSQRPVLVFWRVPGLS